MLAWITECISRSSPGYCLVELGSANLLGLLWHNHGVLGGNQVDGARLDFQKTENKCFPRFFRLQGSFGGSCAVRWYESLMPVSEGDR